MTEIAAACVGTLGFATPSIIEVNSHGLGLAMAFPNSLAPVGNACDFLFHWQSLSLLSTISPVAGYTGFGGSVTCDASGNDGTVLLSAKKVTANGEGIPATTLNHRSAGVLVRDLDPDFLLSVTGKYAYDVTIGAGLTIPGFTPTRAVPMLVFSKISGLSSVPLDTLGLTQLIVQSAGNAEVRAGWTVTATAAYAGGVIGTTPSATQARATAIVPLYGRQL